MTDAAPGVYIDANAFIYFLEGEDAVAKCLRPFFELLGRRPGMAATSELTLAEVLPKANRDTRQNYLNLIVGSGLFDLRPITRELLIETVEYRRSFMEILANGRTVMPKLPDAIHVVTAMRSGCRAILSADSGLKIRPGITLYQPNEAGIGRLMREIA